MSLNNHGLAFVGAMNRDIIMRGADISEVLSLAVTHGNIAKPFEETIVADHLCENLIGKFENKFDMQLGGSAFNAARAAELFSSNTRIGFVGVAGREGDRYPHLDYLASTSIEHKWIKKSGKIVACSACFEHDGDRTLLTSVGANSDMSEFLSSNWHLLREYLGSFKHVHITSFFDDETPKTLNLLVAEVLEFNPAVEISIDPGSDWSRNPSSAVKGLISKASVIHLNEREFSVLGGKFPGEKDNMVAMRIAGMMRDGVERIVILRRHDSVTLFCLGRNGIASQEQVKNKVLLSSESVVNATGAGDTLAGVLMGIVTSPLVGFTLAAAVSMRATVSKISHEGPVDNRDVRLALDQFLK